MRDARAMCERVARLVGCDASEVLVASTGVIGVPLPIDRVLASLDAAFASLGRDDAASRRFLDAIQTTDAFPKEAGEVCGDFAVAGVAKGAGMIEPRLATMISVVGTSAALTTADLRAAAPRVAARSFNAVHVDSHASTNDTFLLFSTSASPSTATSPVVDVLGRVSERLAWLIARDGEGATKVTTIEVRGALDDAAAGDIARRVARSALVRTALFGNDPNWGRFVSAVGNSPVAGDTSKLECRLQDIVVFERGEPASFDRAAASRAMASDDVRLVLDLHCGGGSARVMTSDLGYRYVEVNAEYTT
jgi:glutamate N-acetyltransferase/amino-acid N-acetyltransferase